MKKILLASLFAATLLFAKSGCVLVQSGKLDVIWQAYKTPQKVGVKGRFLSVTYIPHQKEGENFSALFVGSKVIIDTSRIDTGNGVRDERLVKYFFTQLKDTTITGEIRAMHPDAHTKGKPYTGTMEVAFTLNGRTVLTTLDYHYEKESFKAQGNIDLFDFAANKALAGLNSACYDLHQGKTWSDVSIGFVTQVKATLCHADVGGK